MLSDLEPEVRYLLSGFMYPGNYEGGDLLLDLTDMLDKITDELVIVL